MSRSTSKEETSLREVQRKKDAVTNATFNLLLLQSCRKELESKGQKILRNAIKSLREEINWLIDESDDYKEAAAKIFANSSSIEPRPESQNEAYMGELNPEFNPYR